MSNNPIHPEPPGAKKLLWELPKAAKEMASLADRRWHSQLKQAPKGDGHPVITIPGMGGGDGSMSVLRFYLGHLGYDARGWGLGTNILRQRVQSLDEVLEFCAEKEATIVKSIEKIADQKGEKVSLIGWSLGGIYANSIAQTHPDLVRQIITLGSPVGDPRGTSVWNILKFVFGGELPDHLQNVEGWMSRRDQLGEREVRTSLIYSEHDGAVATKTATLDEHPMVENIHIPSSHVGFSHNPSVYWVIADRLSQDIDDWNAFDHNGLPEKIRSKL